MSDSFFLLGELHWRYSDSPHDENSGLLSKVVDGPGMDVHRTLWIVTLPLTDTGGIGEFSLNPLFLLIGHIKTLPEIVIFGNVHDHELPCVNPKRVEFPAACSVISKVGVLIPRQLAAG